LRSILELLTPADGIRALSVYTLPLRELPLSIAAGICDTRKGMYKRIVLKLSGEALAGNKGLGLDSERVIETIF
jgi:hypothetical protein